VYPQHDSPLLEEERPAKDILWRVDIDLPTAVEVREARIAANLNGAQFGREVGRCRVGWLHGEPLAKHPYRRSTIHMIENGKIPVSKAFAVAFRRWQGKVPTGVTFLSGVRSIVDIPEEQIIVWGKLVQCEICGRMLIGHPLTRYCPASVSPECRAEVKRRKAEARREREQERRYQRWLAEGERFERELKEAESARQAPRPVADD